MTLSCILHQVCLKSCDFGIPISEFSDASHLGFGGYSATLDGSPISGIWTADDINKSSTYRELKAIFYVCVSYVGQLKQKKVKLFTDNQAAVRIVSIGSSCPELQAIALQIFSVCLTNHIELPAEWIPRESNQRADLLSRFIDKDDWSIHPTVFRLLDAKWGPYTIDRCASYYNFQLFRYNTRFSSPGSSGVDAFAGVMRIIGFVLPVCLIVRLYANCKVAMGSKL